MKLPKLKPLREYTTVQQLAASLGIVLLIGLLIAVAPAVAAVAFFASGFTFVVWILVFKVIL